MDKKSEYLSYVNTMYGRESAKGQQSGITRWAVIVALVYIAWETVKVYPDIIESEHAFLSAIFLYGLFQISIDNAADFFRPSFLLGQTTKYNLRIKGNGFWEKQPNWLVPILLMLLPLLSQFFRSSDLYTFESWLSAQGFIEAQAIINCYLLSLLLISITGYLIISSIYEKRKGFPFPITFIALTRNENAGFISSIITFELAFGNSIAAYLLVNFISKDTVSSVVTFSLNLALIVLALSFLARTRHENDRLESIRELERDIIFHDLSEAEIKSRIQDEFIGLEFGEWLTIKVEEIISKAESLNQLTAKVIKTLEDIHALPADLKYEREGRKNQAYDELESAFKNYQQLIGPLLGWLDSAITKNGSYQKHVILTIKEKFSTLKEVNNSTQANVLQALEKMKAQIKERRPQNSENS